MGFRYAVARSARQLGVVGIVRNLPDGSVELIAEGAAESVLNLLGDIADQMRGNIEKAEEEDEPPTGKFSTFKIAF